MGSTNNGLDILYHTKPFHGLCEVSAFAYCQRGRTNLAFDGLLTIKETSRAYFKLWSHYSDVAAGMPFLRITSFNEDVGPSEASA